MKTSGARGIEARGGCGEEVVLLRRVAEFELAEVGAVGGGELRGAPACVGERTDKFVRRNISHDARTAKVDVVEGYFYGSKCREGHDHAGEAEIGRGTQTPTRRAAGRRGLIRNGNGKSPN